MHYSLQVHYGHLHSTGLNRSMRKEEREVGWDRCWVVVKKQLRVVEWV